MAQQQRWLDIFRDSGDANVGQTLLRLARLAESVHHHEAAAGLAAQSLIRPRRVEGLDPTAAVPQGIGALVRPHTEVGP